MQSVPIIKRCYTTFASQIVGSKCYRRQHCSISATTGIFGYPRNCRNTYKYLYVKYQCESTSGNYKSCIAPFVSVSSRASRRIFSSKVSIHDSNNTAILARQYMLIVFTHVDMKYSCKLNL
jgi:hypothetical protein